MSGLTSLGRPISRVSLRRFYDFYMAYPYPYGTVSTIVCSELDALASVMARINARFAFDSANLSALQRLDGYSPVRFFDMGDYVRQLCSDPALLGEFEAQLERVVPAAFRRSIRPRSIP